MSDITLAQQGINLAKKELEAREADKYRVAYLYFNDARNKIEEQLAKVQADQTRVERALEELESGTLPTAADDEYFGGNVVMVEGKQYRRRTWEPTPDR